MAIYRTVNLSFWTDPKVDDEFTPEDKYFFLYLLTNPHTNICGCYEVARKQMERELGYTWDTIDRLLHRMEEMHNVIKYSPTTKEVLVLNWGRYNWSDSPSVKKNVLEVAKHIKNKTFRQYIESHFDEGADEDEVFEEKSDELDGLSDELQKTVSEWLDYKKEKRQAYKPTGRTAFINKCKKMESMYGTSAVVEVIESSMASGYQGVVWDRIKKPQTKGTNDWRRLGW